VRFFLLSCLGCLFSFSTAYSATARHGNFSGAVEAGFGLALAPTETQWMVDQLEWNQRFDASEKLRFHFDNWVSVLSQSNLVGTFNHSASYFSALQLSGSGFTVANSAAYLKWTPTEAVAVSVGHKRIPFGVESQTTRFDSTTYFYSGAFAQAQANRWLWDLGVQVEWKRSIPGLLQLALVTGRSTAADNGPALVARYEFDWDLGAVTLTPSASGYLGKLQGAPRDTGLSLGLLLSSGAWSLQTEFLHVKGLGTSANTSVYAEPSIDFGPFDFSVKAEFNNNSVANDFNLGSAVTVQLPDKLRLRVLYQAAGLAGSIRAGQHDLRLLLGTHW
jgi:hypothetical protein